MLNKSRDDLVNNCRKSKTKTFTYQRVTQCTGEAGGWGMMVKEEFVVVKVEARLEIEDEV
jgi:hypothetical protein